MDSSTNPEKVLAGPMARLQLLQKAAASAAAEEPQRPINPTSIYTPTELDISHREIRLLTLHPGLFADEIRCSLIRVSLDAESDYEALSYTWGDPTICERILVEDTEFWATLNL